MVASRMSEGSLLTPVSRAIVPGEPKPVVARSSAFGKTIVVGEHAVVYGAHAVAMPLFSVKMQVELTPIGGERADLRGGKPQIRVTLGGRSVTDHVRGIVDDAFECLGAEPFSLDLEGQSSVLIGAGLGSSASLCVVVLRAVAASLGMTLATHDLCHMANRLERRFHGNPSGLDTAVVSWEQVIAFAKGQEPRALTVVRPPEGRWRFAVIDSGIRSSTLTMVQLAAPYFAGEAGDQRLRQFDALARQVEAGLAQGDPLMVASGMEEAGCHLAAAGVVSPPLQDLIGVVQEAGALAAKVTGAGGGGCVMALLHPTESDAQMAAIRDRIGPNRVFDVELL